MVEDGILVVEGNQYTTLALISPRRVVGWAQSNQSAGHVLPWYHVCGEKCIVSRCFMSMSPVLYLLLDSVFVYLSICYMLTDARRQWLMGQAQAYIIWESLMHKCWKAAPLCIPLLGSVVGGVTR